MSGTNTTVVAGKPRVGATGRLPSGTRHQRTARWRLAWLLLTVALAVHVLDEASTGFLSVYNPAAEAVRETLPWLPLPTFTFAGWITGLVLGILALAALTPLARDGRPWMRRLSWAYGAVMTLNGLGHLGASLLFGRWVPGVVSSPFLLAAAVFLLTSVPRRDRVPHPRPPRDPGTIAGPPPPRGLA